MSLPRLLKPIFLAAALFLPVAVPHAETKSDKPSGDTAPTGAELLVATPDMGDPRFEHTVILIIRHDKDGAFGVAINRPVGNHPLAEILDWIGEKHDGVKGKVNIFAGGPMQEQVGFIIHSAEYRRPETMAVGQGVAVTSSVGILKDMGLGKGPKKTLLAFGYAGWMTGQLESEIDHHAWATVPLDPDLIFNTSPDQIWDKAWARRELSL